MGLRRRVINKNMIVSPLHLAPLEEKISVYRVIPALCAHAAAGGDGGGNVRPVRDV